MSGRAPENLAINDEKQFTHNPGESLALIDVETYPAFVSQTADRLDMMAHFSEQMQALTILSWRAPDPAQNFRLLLTEDDHLVERMGRSGAAQIASGNLRTYGQVLLTTHEHLFDCARNRTRNLLRAAPRSKIPQPQLLEVPPGVYSITLYCDTTFHLSPQDADSAVRGPVIDYTMVLRHYAFPPPRVAPVRLSAGFIPWAGGEAAAEAWVGVTSHKSPGVGIPGMVT